MINTLHGLLLPVFVSGILCAAPLDVGDFSFEGNSLGSGQWTNDLGPEWQETGGPNNGNGFEEFIAGFVAHGTDHLGMNQGHDVWQDLAVTYLPNTRYTLRVSVGHRSGNTSSGNRSEYLLGDVQGGVFATGAIDASTLPGQSFADAPPLVFETPSAPSAVGRTIRILLRARGAGRSHFDQVRLEAETLTPPGGALVGNLEATGVSATGASLTGEVIETGVGAPEITVFWGAADGGLNAAAWERSRTLAGTHGGAFSTAVDGLQPGTLVYFTARATNGAGVSWSAAAESFETLPLPPVVENLAATEVSATTATVGAQVISAGSLSPQVTVFYGTSDGGTEAGAWAGSLPLGAFTGSGNGVIGGLAPATSYWFRCRAENAGGDAWATASGNFTTLTVNRPAVANRSASGVTGTSANLRGEVLSTGNDVPTVTLFYGPADGGTEVAEWAQSVEIGAQDGDFSRFIAGLAPQTTYYFRSRAGNAAGDVWAPDTASFATTSFVPDTAVINEVHYNPAGTINLEEFIELFNPGDVPLDLAGWALSDAISYTFPAGTLLPAGGYLLVAEDPAVILARYGKPALGPWSGKLSSSGERIDLRDAAGTLRDRVEYAAGFPWPTAADGGGSSVELIHPSLDNDLAGSWRASGSAGIPAQSWIPVQSTGWKYRKGTSEASSPVNAWRGTGFNDSSWLTGTTPIGIGQTTDLNDMVSGFSLAYRSVYARKTFTVPVGSIPNELALRVRIDDACVVWINGTEVYRTSNAGSGQLAFNFDPPNGVGGTPTSFNTVNLANTAAYLVGGTNVLAIHAFNRNSNTHRWDFLFDAELIRPGVANSPAPTPGVVNSVTRPVGAIPPQIRQVVHTPANPTPGVPVTVSARITDPDGVGAVSLAYQIIDPGAYIRLTDAAYQTTWTAVTMNDAGANGDAVAGDSVFTVVLPAALQTHRRLVRYRITFADAPGNSQTVPYADDEQPNFAYFVYGGVPSWTGAMRPTTFNGFPATPAQTYPAELLESLPPLHLIATATDITNSQYNSSFSDTRFRGTAIQRGVVHDHIEFRVRGIGSTYQSGKNKWNIYFNRARDYQGYDNYGRPYRETWNNLLVNANASPWAAVHRGSGGVEEALSNRIYQLAGMAAMNTQFFHLRVIDDAAESGSTQYEGDFWGLYLGLEPTEGNFLRERDLPSGNLYSIEGNGGDKKHQGATHPVDSSDWSAFSSGLAQAGQTEAWYRANVDLPSLYTFLAISRLIGNVDVRPGDNYRFYHRPTDGRWVIIPYDLDMQFIAAHHWGGSMDGITVAGAPNVIRAISRHPNLAREYRNRCREVLSLMASDGGAAGGQIGQLVAEYAGFIHTPGESLTWANLDAAMWNLHPRTNGGGGNSGQSSHRGNFFRATYLDGSRGGLGGTVSTGSWVRTLADPDGDGFSGHEGLMQWFVNYATDTWPGGGWNRKAMSGIGNGTDSDPNRQSGYGYQYLRFEALNGGWINANANPPSPAIVDFPVKPVASVAGESDFPVNGLSFVSSAFSDPQGAGDYAASQWRIARISAPGIPGHDPTQPSIYEITGTWTSPELAAPPGEFAFPLGIAEAGMTYRVRVRHKDKAGSWSDWSEPVEFTAAAPAPQKLVHYWNFNSAGGFLLPSFSIGGGELLEQVESPAEIIRHNSQDQGFAGLNARNGDPAGAHLRVNHPLGARLDFSLPTTGFEDIVIRYETRRSGQGAGIQQVSSTVDGTTYLPFDEFHVSDADPEVRTLDFRMLEGAANNPAFGIRIAFVQGGGGNAGNNRVDNFTVEGDALPSGYEVWRDRHFADASDEAVAGPFATPAGDGVANLIRYAFGLGPFDPVGGLMPRIVRTADGMALLFHRDPAVSGLRWKVTASADLAGWGRVVFDSAVDGLPGGHDDPWFNAAVGLPDSLDGVPSSALFFRLEIAFADTP